LREDATCRTTVCLKHGRGGRGRRRGRRGRDGESVIVREEGGLEGSKGTLSDRKCASDVAGALRELDGRESERGGFVEDGDGLLLHCETAPKGGIGGDRRDGAAVGKGDSIKEDDGVGSSEKDAAAVSVVADASVAKGNTPHDNGGDGVDVKTAPEKVAIKVDAFRVLVGTLDGERGETREGDVPVVGAVVDAGAGEDRDGDVRELLVGAVWLRLVGEGGRDGGEIRAGHFRASTRLGIA